MKKVLPLFLLSCLSYSGFSQSTTAATYAISTQFGTYTSIAAGTTAATAIGDDAEQTNIAIGFTFRYCGVNYTTLAANSNGFLSLANTGTAGSSYQNGTAELTNQGAGVGMLMPLWDDLNGLAASGTSTSCTGVTATYKTTGSAPNRVFTFEWVNWGLYNYGTQTGCGSFQVKLYETKNWIEFWYGSSTMAGITATIGIANSTADFKTVTSNIEYPGFSTAAFNTSIATPPANGIIYRFCPQNITAVASNSSPFCSGTTAALTGTVTGAAPTYAWGGPNSFTSTVVSPVIPGVTTAATGIYTLTATIGTCSANDTTTMTINQTPSHIVGADTVCVGSSTSLSDGMAGGSWTAVPGTVATINASGVVTGVGAGVANITYTMVATGCDTTMSFTTDPLPVVSPIGGTFNVCEESIVTLTETTGGGVWSSSNTSIATVDPSTGAVTGVLAGPVTISYTVTNISNCVTTVTTPFTVNPLPVVGPITGTTTFCQGSTSTLSNSTSGGSWSSADMSIATVDGFGTVTGVTGGSTTITYTYTNMCGTVSTNTGVTINPLPVSGTITGPSSVCPGVVISLSDASGGGIWSSSDNTLATVDGSGNVTGVTAGVVTIFYTVTNICGTIASSANIAVNNITDPGVIGGPSVVCVGATITLTETVGGGTWASADGTTATIDPSTGKVTGVNAGSVIMSYTAFDVCGPATTTSTVIVNTLAGIGSVSGPTSLCAGSSSTLYDGVSGGAWSSSNSSVATIDPSTGHLNALSVGSVTLTYSVTNICGTATGTFTLSVISTPDPGTIAGAGAFCFTSTSPYTDAVSGGIWSSSNTSVATVDATGNVTGVTAGTTTLSYAVTNFCATSFASRTITVDGTPNSGVISGVTNICVGATSSFTDASAGGVWSSSDNTIATADAAGHVTGAAPGATIINYTLTNTCGTDNSTFPVVISPAPVAGSISGPSSVCLTASLTLTDAASGGVWSTSNASVISVSSSGVVTGVTLGSATISYSVTNSCATAVATLPMTVSPLADPGSISGITGICTGTQTTLTPTVAGGTWSSLYPYVGTVTATGVVTGATMGVTTISYTVTNGCGPESTTAIITVGTPPASAGVLSGGTSACAGGSALLSSSVSGGTWSTSDASVATINSFGVVTAITAGSTNISYTITNSCGTVNTSETFTVNPLPVVTPIVALTTNVCQGSVVTFTDITMGGSWGSSNTSIATVTSSGDITGVAAGTATITYSVFNMCGVVNATLDVTVNPLPAITAISGGPVFCAGTFTNLTDGGSGGTWTSTNTSVASVGIGSGVLDALSTGTSTISYSITNLFNCTSQVTEDITVNPAPVAGTLSGTTTTVCAGANISFSASVGGGTWSSSDNTVATVNSSGVLTGVNAGAMTVSYAVTNSCGTAFATVPVNVNPVPAMSAISGSAVICENATTSLTDATFGGTWSSSNITAASIDVFGNLTGVSAGAATISYAVTNAFGCTSVATQAETVNPGTYAGAMVGSATTVCAGSAITFSDAAPGGIWISSDNTVATVDPTGVVSGVSSGVTTISYSVSNSFGCNSFVSVDVTVNPTPSVSPVTGAAVVCAGSAITLADAALGGAWTSSNVTIATVDAGGTVTGVSAGSALITYTVSNIFGCSRFATAMVTVNPSTVAGSISAATTTVCAGSVISLTDLATGGAWSSSDMTIATVDASGNVTGVSSGAATISYLVSNIYGCNSFAIVGINVNPSPAVGAISGSTNVCAGSATTLSDVTFTGTWVSGSPSVATVDGTGVVTGVMAGTSTISYTVTNAFACSTTVTLGETVNAVPVVAGISGTANLCTGTSTTLTDAASGGTWSGSDNTIATVDGSTGMVTGVAVGSVTISYTVGTICQVTATAAETVNLTPSVGAISGASSICAGGITSLSDGTPFGAWSSGSMTIATVDASGNVTAVSAGTTNISYTVTSGSGCSASAMAAFTVNPLPVISPVSGAGNTCLGTTNALTETTTGGIWSSDNLPVATVDGFGVVTGVSLGTANISYTVTDGLGCSYAVGYAENVAPVPVIGALGGAGSVCAGSTLTLTDTSAGGTWHSVDNTVATVDGSGTVTGVAAGSDVILYTIMNTFGCSAFTTASVTVNPAPAISAISGAVAVCNGSSITLSDADGGGTWSSSAAGVATINASGAVTTTGVGTATITYFIAGGAGCNSTVYATVTVNPVPVVAAVSGSGSICVGATATLSDATGGGSWSSSDLTIATIDATGMISGVGAGTVGITYMVTNGSGCSTSVTASETVNPLPAIGAISGTTVACLGSSVTLTDGFSGGTWTSSTSAVASVNSTSGEVTTAGIGTTTITYSISNAFGCSSMVTSSFTVDTFPLSSLLPAGGSATLCPGSSVMLSVSSVASGLTYQWYKDGTLIAGATDVNYSASADGLYSVTISNGTCSETLTGVNVVAPVLPAIHPGIGSILYTGSYSTYQWYLNGAPILGATTSVYNATTPGSYTVMVTSGSGCVVMSAPFVVSGGGGGGGSTAVVNVTAADIKLYPNPATSVIHIDAPVKVDVSVFSPEGQLLIRSEDATDIDVSNLANGMYMVLVYDRQNNLLRTDKFIKMQ